ncbi:hypothetical protein [Ornithinibacillus halophilus]|uniref:Uncharacterized protein n=1 Tax=Ornithinibacillus halophilus TaxID=930117 RepID=A0A1M5L1K5_9BACI|nr:hypothetical protein [Ornithinibacillus halophilus]SHG58825.1 hypothetical protein SAMN05216225_104316 [Ornithinibacillus halophilus]
MKKKVIEWFIKFAWPAVKFVIINFGQTIAKFIFESLKARAREKSINKMEEALKHAKNAEKAAESTNDPKEKMQYYEVAKAYKEEAEYQRRFLADFLDEIENSAIDILETVQQKSSEVEVEDLFIMDKKQGKLKAVENQEILDYKSNKNNKQ